MRAVVPGHRQLVQCALRQPPAVGDHRHGIIHLPVDDVPQGVRHGIAGRSGCDRDHVVHAFTLQHCARIETPQPAAEHRRLAHRRVFHARHLDIDPVHRGAGRFSPCIESRQRLADQLPVRCRLQGQGGRIGRWQRCGGRRQPAEAEASAAGRIAHLIASNDQRIRRYREGGRCGLLQQTFDLGAGHAHRIE